MNFCEHCGKKLEGTQGCGCSPPESAQGGPEQAPPSTAHTPQQQPPQIYGPQQPGCGLPPNPPQYGPAQSTPPGPPPPSEPQQPGAASQTFGEIKGTLGGFAKDPYGAATRAGGLNMPVSVSLLGVQALAFTLMIAVALNKIADAAIKSMTGAFGGYYNPSAAELREMKNQLMGSIKFYEYIKIALCAVIGIGALFICIFLVAKIARIHIASKTMLSTLAISSIIMSVVFVAVMVLLIFLGFSAFSAGIYYMILCMGAIASLLLLEISLRGVMPPNTGNVKRLFCLTVSYAASHALTFFLVGRLIYDNAFDGLVAGFAGIFSGLHTI